jgi:hypothetical protein
MDIEEPKIYKTELANNYTNYMHKPIARITKK